LIEKVYIGEKAVGEGEQTYIILEAGSNWLDLDHKEDGEYNFNNALRLIDKASELGADAIKFQTFHAKDHHSKRGPKPDALKDKPDLSLYNIIKELEMPREWLPELADYSKKKGIHFISSPCDYEAVDILVGECDAPAIKVASFDIVDIDLLKYIALKKRPVIVSTGMADLQDIDYARVVIEKNGVDDIVFLHCISNYPAKISDLNLRRIDTIREITQHPVGFSDHSLEYWVPAVAVAMGASLIEKHFTLNKALKGPDHFFALNPQEAENMIRMVRDVEKMMGSPLVGHIPAEEEYYRINRRCVQVGMRGIKKGEVFFIPEGVRHRYSNFYTESVKVLFGIAPEL